MRNDFHSDAEKDPDELEREVDQQRAYINETLSALERKFSPGQIFDQVLHYTRSNGGDFSRNLVDTVKNNPVPTLLTATGLLWMMYGQNRSRYYTDEFEDEYMSNASYGVDPDYEFSGDGKTQKLKDKASHLREGTEHSIGKAKERMHYMGDAAHGRAQRTRQQLYNARNSIRHQTQRAGEGFEHMLREQPLALGAIGVALGALVGAVVPQSRKEHELMGKKRDQLASKASQMAQEGYDKAQEFGSRVTEDAKQEMERETQQVSPQPSSTSTPGSSSPRYS